MRINDTLQQIINNIDEKNEYNETEVLNDYYYSNKIINYDKINVNDIY